MTDLKLVTNMHYVAFLVKNAKIWSYLFILFYKNIVFKKISKNTIIMYEFGRVRKDYFSKSEFDLKWNFA